MKKLLWKRIYHPSEYNWNAQPSEVSIFRILLMFELISWAVKQESVHCRLIFFLSFAIHHVFFFFSVLYRNLIITFIKLSIEWSSKWLFESQMRWKYFSSLNRWKKKTIFCRVESSRVNSFLFLYFVRFASLTSGEELATQIEVMREWRGKMRRHQWRIANSNVFY